MVDQKSLKMYPVKCVISSEVERCPDSTEVKSSNLLSRTKNMINNYAGRVVTTPVS